MDSAELLDLLGNANRRRILRLLAHKPCYVTEISEYLGVSPKAVIDHLEKLEAAGLVRSRTDDRQRKYFSIASNLRLEVQVTPYQFGTKSAYPASPGFDVSSCRYLSIEVSQDQGEALPELADELRRLQQLENELSLAQRWVQGRLTDVQDRISDAVDADGEDGRLHAAVVGALADGHGDVAAISRVVEAPPDVVRESLQTLADRGVAESGPEGWRLAD